MVLTSAESTPFTASGQVHPGKMEIANAKALVIPHIVLASNGEPEDVVKEYHDLLVGEGKPNGKLFPVLLGGGGGSELTIKSEKPPADWGMG